MPLTLDQARRLAAAIDLAQAGDAAAPDPPTIAGYEIVRRVAVGGMGVVYEARQHQPSRRVAIKVMHREFASRTALRRFRHEADILARLRHPNVGHIYEAGTYDDGDGATPYFVMEYIEHARPITDYCTTHALPPHRRLELLALACDAVHHGHQRGIIHRDLKPDNILVGRPDARRDAEADAAPEVKVIDFGVARATDADTTLTTIATEVGQIIGTVQYMSPEQCAGDPDELDTRSDVYALGVVLYELLTGRLPYDLAGRSLPAATRIIQDEAPVRPSTVTPALRGDLEAIVLKALEKDRERRYSSAAELAADIRRSLAGEPVDARTPGRWRRAAQWIGRHPLLTTAAFCTGMVAAVAGATSLSVWWYALQPFDVAVRHDERVAALVSRAGHELYTWDGGAAAAIVAAELIARPASQGGGRIALIGLRTRDLAYTPPPHAGAFCAWSIDDPDGDPVWRAVVDDDDLPYPLPERGDTGRSFTPYDAIVADVFPQRDGCEIVAWFQSRDRSQGVLRIYDLAGTMLYQAWHDGNVGEMLWVPQHDLLIIHGSNGEVYWEQRDPDGYRPQARSAHPRVVFALRPQFGATEPQWINTAPGHAGIDPVWYRCLLPIQSLEWAKRLYLTPVRPDTGEPGIAAFFISLHHPTSPGFRWNISLDGQLLKDTLLPNDAAQRNAAELPSPAAFSLGDLPPVLDPDTGAILDRRGWGDWRPHENATAP